MSYTPEKTARLNVPFAHAFDPTTGTQVPMVMITNPGSGGGDGGTTPTPGAGGPDREFLTVDYQVKTAFTGADVGDFIRSVEVWDISTTTSTQVGSTVWRNLSKGTTLASAPPVANIGVAGSSTAGLTNAQLRGDPLPLMVGAATSEMQQAINTLLEGMSGKLDTLNVKVSTNSGLASIFDQIGATNVGMAALNGKVATDVTLTAVGNIVAALRDKTPGLGAKVVAGASAVSIATDDPMIGAPVTAAGALGAGGLGLMGWISTLVLRLPASLGLKASAASLPVVLASDDAQIGTKVTAIPALATGGSGLIGWLSAQWQALVNLGNQFPATIGRKASAASMSVVLASDDAQVGTPLTSSAALGAGGTGMIGWLSSIRDSLLGLLTVNTLAQPLVARKLPVTTASAPQALTVTCRRVSIVAVSTSIRYVISTGTPTANVNSHLIMAGERLDLSVPASCVIAAISDTTSPGVLEISELG